MGRHVTQLVLDLIEEALPRQQVNRTVKRLKPPHAILLFRICSGLLHGSKSKTGSLWCTAIAQCHPQLLRSCLRHEGPQQQSVRAAFASTRKLKSIESAAVRLRGLVDCLSINVKKNIERQRLIDRWWGPEKEPLMRHVEGQALHAVASWTGLPSVK